MSSGMLNTLLEIRVDTKTKLTLNPKNRNKVIIIIFQTVLPRSPIILPRSPINIIVNTLLLL
jgi:hypothetical protein